MVTTMERPTHPDPVNASGLIEARDPNGDGINPRAIWTARMAQRLSRERLADRIGVSLSTISRWEYGDHQPLRVFEPALEAFIEETNGLLLRGKIKLPTKQQPR
jgi:hypothetical protein